MSYNNENLGTVNGLDYYDRKELCDLYNESDSKAFDYLMPYTSGEMREKLEKLVDMYENGSYTELQHDKVYQKLLWEFMNQFGIYKNKLGEAFTRY